MKTRNVFRVKVPGQMHNLSLISGVLEKQQCTCHSKKYDVMMDLGKTGSV